MTRVRFSFGYAPIIPDLMIDDSGQTRFVTLIIALVVLFGLALAYNATSETSPETENFLENSQEPGTPLENTQEETTEESEPLVTKARDVGAEGPLPGEENTAKSSSRPEETEDNNTLPPVCNQTQDVDNFTGFEPETPVNRTENNSANNQTVQDSDNKTPELTVEIIGDEKVIRGGNTLFQAVITNNGSTAKEVFVRWDVPEDFIVVNEKGNSCGNLRANENCVSVIEIRPALVLSLGRFLLNVEISYS